MNAKLQLFKNNRRKAIKANRKVVTHIHTVAGLDFIDPCLVYAAVLEQTGEPACLMESAVHTGGRGRYSYICPWGRPFSIIQKLEWIENIQKMLRSECPMPHRTLEFVGGAVGYIGHDAINAIETTVTQNPVDPFGLPTITMHFFSCVIIYDHEKSVLHYVSNVDVSLGDAKGFERVNLEIQKMQLFVEAVSTVSIPDDDVSTQEIESNLSKEQFEEMVLQAKDHIAKGDVFQVVLSRRLSVPFIGSGLSFYRALRISNPSRYLFHMRLGQSCRNAVIIGASPEVMSKVQKGKMIVRPLAGTAKRGATPNEDKSNAEKLLNDPKEEAEHRMLVDLARNDVSRFCKAESVKVTSRMQVEYFKYVMHIGSEVSGELNHGVIPFLALLGVMPAGTLSGAPKVEALRIISELEPSRRGPYGGAFGWFTDTALDTCIFIRSALLLEGKLYWQTGAGIVADSIPEKEYVETVIKAKGIETALKHIEHNENK